MAKLNWKIYFNIGFTLRATQRCIVMLDISSAYNFIQKDVIPKRTWYKIKLSLNLNVFDANILKFHTIRTTIAIKIVNRVEMMNWNVVERIATNILLGWNYCDRHVESIKPLQQIEELGDWITVPITRNDWGRSHNEVPLSEAQRLPKRTKRASTKIEVSHPVTLQP